MIRILVVEDKASELAAMAEALQTLDAAIDQARNGVEALNFLECHIYSLVVTDLLMPQVSGFDLVEWIRERHAGLPILVCSAYVTSDVFKSLRQHPYVEILSKPFRSAALVETAKRMLRSDPCVDQDSP